MLYKSPIGENNPCNQFKITCSTEISFEHRSTSSGAGRKPPSRMYISTTANIMSSEKDEVYYLLI